MSDGTLSTIAPPPSIDDILAKAQDDRIGRVDFSERLAPAPQDGAPEADDQPESPSSLTSAPVAPVALAQPQVVATPEPDVEAAAGLPDEVVQAPVAERPQPTRPPAPKPAALAPPAKQAKQAKQAKGAKQAEPTPPAPDDKSPESAAAAASLPVAIEREPVDAVTPEPVKPLEPLEKVDTEPAAMLVEDAHDDEVLDLGRSVEEVAEAVIASMTAAGEAHIRHLDAIENEAARRCELLTAQAELDAELIRLQARREAHAIITAARLRAGAGSEAASAETRLLSTIGESLSRFAETIETIETTVAPAPGSLDHPRIP